MEFMKKKNNIKAMMLLALCPFVMACGSVTPEEAAAATQAKETGYVQIKKEQATWVFDAQDENFTKFKSGQELAKHVTKLSNVAGKIKIYKAPDTETLKGFLALKPGYVTRVQSGYLWVYKAGSEELDKANKGVELAKHSTVLQNVDGQVTTLKAPSKEIIRSYIATKPGYTAIVKDDYLWVFADGSKDLATMQQGGELAKHVTVLQNMNGKIVTIKSDSKDTIKSYLAAKEGFITRIQSGYLWVYFVGSPELEKALNGEELAKHVTRLTNVNGKVQIVKAPSNDVLNAYFGS